MIIDFHTHMFPDAIAARTVEKLAKLVENPPETDGTHDGLFRSAQEAGIDCSVVLPIATKASQFYTINEYAAHFQKGKIISFGSIHPASENYKEELREINAMGIKGIKLHPDYQGVYFSVHAGQDPLCPEDIHCTPQMAAELIEDVAPEKLVLAHLGGNQQWDEVERYLVGKNVYLDTAVIFDYIEQEQFLRILRNHGSDKVLFATDSPWAGQKRFVDLMKEMPVTEKEREDVLGGNAAELLGLL